MKKILAVDDQPEILGIIADFLEGKYEVYQAKTTAKATALLRTTNFDCILLDFLMPGMSGIEFLEYIQEQTWYEKTPVIFVSSESDFQTVLQAVKLGAIDYIKKPIDKNLLLAKVQIAIGGMRGGALGKKKVLAVDDQSKTLDLIESFLDSKYEVYQAKTTARAISLLHTADFDCIVFDIAMTGMNGIEFFEYVQKKGWYKDTPVLFLLSEFEEHFQIMIQTVKINAVSYIKKPIQKDPLLKHVKELIDKHSAV